MGKFDGVLLVSDFDDTLAGAGAVVSQENKAAITRFMEQGGRFSIATGRAHATFAHYAREIPMNAPTVLYNGSSVYDFASDTVLLETWLPARAQDDLPALAAAFPTVALEVCHDEDIYLFRPNRYSAAHMEKIAVPYIEAALDQIPAPWIKSVLLDDYATLRAVQAHVLAQWGEHYECIFSNRMLLELTRKGSNKGGMVRWVAERLGISAQHIYCVGDNQNDLSMLAVSAIPFAPANCADEVRASGAHLLGSCDEHCVAELIALLEQRY